MSVPVDPKLIQSVLTDLGPLETPSDRLKALWSLLRLARNLFRTLEGVEVEGETWEYGKGIYELTGELHLAGMWRKGDIGVRSHMLILEGERIRAELLKQVESEVEKRVQKRLAEKEGR